MDENCALMVLIAYAEKRLFHKGGGLCPDELEGHDSRDPECEVCQALEVMTK